MSQKIALVTGASSGIGRSTAEQLAHQGYYVFVCARRTQRLEELRGPQIEPLPLDVTDEAAVNNAIEHVIHKKGRIDLLVNNAGFSQLGAIEAVTIEAAKYQFDVNVFGYARFMRAVLPHMRAQQSGHIINVTSAVGKVSMAAFGWYAATKHAIEALSDALRNEVKQFGIHVTLIEPGLIDTEFLELQAERLENTPHPPAYRRVIEGVPKALSGKAATPSIIGKAIVQAADSNSPPIRKALPADAKAALFIRRYLGDSIFDWGVRRLMGL